jgi:NAD(P)H-hydrate epimerase
MVSVWQPETSLVENATALMAGPGLAASNVPDQLRNFVQQNWRDSPLPMVVDASALGWLTRGPVPAEAVRVITPHPGEAARLLGITSKEVQGARTQALRRLSERFGNAWVVLKGHQTLIGRNRGAVYVNCSGNPYLAQGGSGDLLSGFIAGLLAQPTLASDPLKTIRYAVWQHGACADLLQADCRGWVVEDLAETLGEVSPGPCANATLS